MIHIDDGKKRAVCKARVQPADQLVLVALHSDCVECRTQRMIGPPTRTGCAVRTPLSYTPQPHPKAGERTLEELQQWRDGR